MEYEIREAIYEHRISFKIEQDPVKKAYYYLKPEQDNCRISSKTSISAE